ncbi:putative colanic acid biosysnthesis UDP-glucose lipid carrier transferase [Allopseudospirillum japonicum]|uniref:Putative colanic acid biosysnthesis UDP-glucose lipid carrier transferase n=1 Tax=Allopseudospirillum japonicum TaxID=64971 RepID=A0A1H6SQ47_9GAMM|nr:undecaprenyl-phosphate glucose phosphotransferase [Allopseudospirillum japonicum]SEI68004.1 putative colanic acid biosysnthesis UDP-glucose lipid carrier transferase [Allopseudospirillum japonicum]
MKITETGPLDWLAHSTRLLDLALSLAAAWLAWWLAESFTWLAPATEFSKHALISLGASVLLVWVGGLCGLYRSWRGRSLTSLVGQVMLAWLLTLALLVASAFLIQEMHALPRAWALIWCALGLVFAVSSRILVYKLLRLVRAQGWNLKPVLVIGTPAAIDTLHTRLQAQPDAGFCLGAQVIFPSTETSTETPLDAPTESTRLQTQIQQALQAGCREIWIALPLSYGAQVRQLLDQLAHVLVDIRYIPDLSDVRLLNHSVSQVAGIYTLDLNRSPLDGAARWIKALEDRCLGLVFFLISLPVMLCIACAIKLTSQGPILFKQYRTGLDGRDFKIYKFRTMRLHQEAQGQLTQAYQGDPRITRLGALLRRTSLDELPQFFNVLQGRMSIVGPRPHALEHNEYYKDLIEAYMQRHRIKPGITGWAQVNGLRGETQDLQQMQQRIEYDLFYIDHWSLGFDLKIIALTLVKGFYNRAP